MYKKGTFVIAQSQDNEVFGYITKIEKDEHGYTTIYLNVDGMTYKFGTGGHLGTSWTSGDEQEWFLTFNQ